MNLKTYPHWDNEMLVMRIIEYVALSPNMPEELAAELYDLDEKVHSDYYPTFSEQMWGDRQ